MRRQDHHLALQAARRRESTEAYAEEYARRAGVEGMLSQRTRAYGLRRACYIGEEKTALQHILTAAINFVRMANWLMEKSLAKTRESAYERAMNQFAFS